MKLVLTVLGGSLVLAGCVTGPRRGDHEAHHAPGAAAAAPAAPTSGQIDSMMKSMQEMHDKMMAAKTPEERAKPDAGTHEGHAGRHGHDGSHARRQGRDGDGWNGRRKSMGPEMMGKRMDMMEMMMQMMMDREAMKPPAAK